ncbi:MAG: hypothetical protein JWQ71_2571 [Pedosphaera sp.]|nr:hypothetical protein [Pedosphaera sp.]
MFGIQVILLAIGSNLQYLSDTPLKRYAGLVCFFAQCLIPLGGYIYAFYFSPTFAKSSSPVVRIAILTILSFHLTLVGSIAGLITVSFLPSLEGTVDAQAKISAEMTNSFNLPLPNGFTNVNSRFYSYWSMDGGARVYLSRLDGNDSAATNLLKILEQKNITIIPFSPTANQNEIRRASWWRPDEYGTAIAFDLQNANNDPKRRTRFLVEGYLFSTPTNHPLFLRMMEVYNDDYREPK